MHDLCRTILVPMTDHPADADSLKVALRLGQRWGAHVRALYTAIDSRDAVAFLGEGMTAGMIEKVMEASAADCRVRNTHCHEIYEAAGLGKRPSAAALAVAQARAEWSWWPF